MDTGEELERRDDVDLEAIAVIAHELRNVLGPLQTASLVISREAVHSETSRRCSEIITRQVAQMSRLVDDLVDSSGLGHTSMRVERKTVVLQDVISHAVDLHRTALETRCQTLDLALPEASVLIDADAFRLTQVFSNILHNAVRYTPTAGRISLVVRQEGAEAVVEVSDTGMGLPADRLESIFQPFAREPDAKRLAPRGLGIGLALVKHIVAQHAGHVVAASAGRGCGSTFTVRLPLSRTT